MKNAKKIGIAIVQVVIAGILVFIAIKHSDIDKQKGTDVGQIAVEEVEQTPVPSATATPESATSETANADGYGEETLTQTEDGSYLDGEASDDEESLSDEETEQPAATATPQPTAVPQPVQATPQPTAVPQPAATAVPHPVDPQPADPQPAVLQPDQSQDAGAVPDWFDSSDTGYDYDFDWGDTVLQ